MIGMKWMYQADEHKGKLDDIGVGYRVQPSHQSVDDGHSSRNPNRHVQRDVHHHANCQSYTQELTLVPVLASSNYCGKAAVHRALWSNMNTCRKKACPFC